MVYSHDIKKYREQYISTMTPPELVTLLYNEIIKNLKKSIIAINNKDIDGAHNSIVSAENIILHLIKSLDLSYPISFNLLKLYEYMYDCLIKSNVEKNSESINHIINMVADLRSTWVQAEKQSRMNSFKSEAK